MYPTTERFRTALSSSHKAIARASLYVDRHLEVADVPIISGSVTEDTSSLFRSRCSVALVPTDDVLAMLPEFAPIGASLWPLGTEIAIESGIEFSDGTQEWIPQGFFRINRPVLDETYSDVSVSIEGYDRSRTVSRYRFTTPYVITNGTNYSVAIRELIKSRLPWMNDNDLRFMETEHTAPQLVFTMDDDPWDVALAMADSFGAELFWDNLGRCVLRPQPDALVGDPDWTYEEGDQCTILALSRELDDEYAYNGVIVTGESPGGTPIYAEAWDTNFNSPTYFDPSDPTASTYGAVPTFINSQYITTQAQAQAAAQANLVKKLGVLDNLDLTLSRNPAHQGGDIVCVQRARTNINNCYILDGLTKGLAANEDISAVCRSRRAS